MYRNLHGICRTVLGFKLRIKHKTKDMREIGAVFEEKNIIW